MTFRFLLRAFLIAMIAVNAAVATESEPTFLFDIPESDMGKAISKIALQSGHSAIFSFSDVKGQASNPVTGTYTLTDALERLLANTGFEARLTADGVITLITPQTNDNNEGQKMNLNRKSGFLGAFFSALWGTQAANVAVAQESTSGFVLEELVVTARKVTENQQDVPISITTLSADALERRQIVGTADIGKITPNLNFTGNAPLSGNNNAAIVFIRGVGQISTRANTDPGVALYIDDVYMGQSVGGVMELKDISGVQVLRGPQGTLFGRNTIGGAVVLTTADPGDELGGKLRFGTGDDSLFELFGAVDVPFSDRLRARFTAGIKQQDGYVTRLSDGTDLGDTDNETWSAKFVFDPTDSVTAKLKIDHTESEENGSPMVFAGINNNTQVDRLTPPTAGFMAANASVGAGCPDAWVTLPGPFPIEGSLINDPGGVLGTVVGPPLGYVGEINDPRCANSFQDAGPYANNGTAQLGSSLDNSGISLSLEWAFSENWTFKSVTAYRELEWEGRRDADNMPLTILHTYYSSEGDQFSQELQFTYQSENLSAVLGAYYYEEEVEDILSVDVGDRGAGFTCGVDGFGNVQSRCHIDSDNNITENEASALFAQLTYDFTENLSGTFGVRYTEETKASTPEQFDWADSVNGDVSTVNGTPTAGQAAGTEPGWGDFYLEPRKYEEDFSATTISANLSYTLSESTMVYASYSEGFKGGGWNSSFNFAITPDTQAAGQKFDQEEVETFELGFKSDLTDSLRINGAVFSSDYTDLQFIYRVFVAPWLFNAGKASIDGAELEFTWLPNPNWILEGGFGVLDSSIDETATIVVPGLPVSSGTSEGNQLPFAPDFQANLGIGYITQLGEFEISPRLDFSYSDKVYFDASNTEAIAQQDSYSTIDLSVAFTNTNDDWKVTVGLRNATDEEYRTSGNSSLSTGTGYAEVAYARPKMWFANFSKEF